MLQRKIKPGILASLGCCNKYNRLGGLNNKHLFLTLWGLRIPRPFLVSSESPFPGLWATAFLLYPHTAEIKVFLCLFYKGTDPVHEGSTLMT